MSCDTLYRANGIAMWVDLASELTSFNKTLAAFSFVFIVKMYNNLSERFAAEMV